MSGPTKSGARCSDDQGQNLPLTRDEAERILRAPAGKRFSLPADWDERVEYLAPALNMLTARMVLDAALRSRRPSPGAYAALKLTHPAFYAETERFREALRLFHARTAGSA